VTQLVKKADRKTAWEFLEYMLEAVPYQVHTILTDNHCPEGDCEAIRREEASSSLSNGTFAKPHIQGQCAST
jgi:hypothetical protein